MICNKCTHNKPETEFYFRKDRNKYYTYCNKCRRDNDKKYHHKNKNKINTKKRKDYHKNIEKRRARIKELRINTHGPPKHIKKTKKERLEIAKNIAELRGGKLLNTEYSQKLDFKCKYEHVWSTTLKTISGKSKSWCPYCCKRGLSENICRKYLEELFDYKFPKTRPLWLLNNNGNRLELDGFCKELNIAFEHNGRQHYENIKFYNKKIEPRKENDKIKKELCEKYKIKLIEIPQLNIYTKNLNEHIKNECVRLNIKMPEKVIDINNLRINSTQLDWCYEYAKNKSGECLSNYFSERISWRCRNGHEWQCNIYSMRHKNTWCKRCLQLRNK